MTMEKSRRSVGVTIFAKIFLWMSIVGVYGLIFSPDAYFKIFGYLPGPLIFWRYIFSWTYRCVGILIALGLLTLKDVARKAAIILAAATIFIVYLKHPYAAFQAQAALLDRHHSNLLVSLGVSHEVTFASMALYSMLLAWIAEIAFCSAVILFFTRPAVKAQFRSM